MNANEIRNAIANNNAFTFNTSTSAEAQVLCGLIHNAGFDTITIPHNGECLVVVINSEFTKNILERDIFPALADSICALLCEVNFNLGVIPANANGQLGRATQGRTGILRHKMAKLIDRFGQNAIAHWLKEDMELNEDVMDADRKVAIQTLLG